MLRWRITLGAVFIACLAGLAWLDHVVHPRGLVLGPLAVLLCVPATAEAVYLLRGAGAQPYRLTTYAASLLPVVAVASGPLLTLWTGTAAESTATQPWQPPPPEILLGPALLLGLLIAAIAAIRLFDGTQQSAIDFAATIFAAVYVGGAIGTLAQLRLLESRGTPDRGVVLLIATIVIVKAGDTGAYTVGRLIGRRKLAPRLSPGKTWEGAMGAVAFSCLASTTALILAANDDRLLNVETVLRWLLFGVALSVAGMVGDLAESLLKRSARVKDSSAWMPGFGGVLDVLDSLLLAAPVAYGCAILRLVG